MATTTAKTTKRCGSPAQNAIIFAIFAGMSQPELIPVPLVPVAFLAMCLPGILLVLILGALKSFYGHATSYYRSRQHKKSQDEQVELQSISKALTDLEGLMWKTKHIPLMNLVSTFLTAEEAHAKISSLLGIWQLYTDRAPTVQLKDLLDRSLPLFTKAVESACRLSNKIMKTNFDVVEQQGDEGTTWYDTMPEVKEIVDELFQNDPERVSTIEKHRDLIVIAAAATAFLGAVIPSTIIWKKDEKMSFSKALIEHGRCITAKNIIWAEVTNTKNNILWLIWKVCGYEYIPKNEKAAIQVQKLAIQTMKDLREYEVLMNSDFFGSMRSDKLITIERAVKQLDTLFKDLSQVQRSQYNLNTVFTVLKTGYEEMLRKRVDLIMNATGKQAPVVIQLAGPAGHGKSEFMKELVAFVEKTYGVTTYYRNVHEEHWSHFGGQQVLVWDDIGFSKEGKEYTEFCYHTAGAPSSTTGAAIVDKGRPTNPLFIFLTSNHPYLGPQGHNLATPEAFHRRRDILISFTNSKAQEYMDAKGSSIPSNLYDKGATTMTLLRSVPLPDAPQISDNVIGVVTPQRLFESMVEIEKEKGNRFKSTLRMKTYYKGKIPEDQEVDYFKTTQDFLIGKTKEVTTVPISVLFEDHESDEDLSRSTSTLSLEIAKKEKIPPPKPARKRVEITTTEKEEPKVAFKNETSEKEVEPVAGPSKEPEKKEEDDQKSDAGIEELKDDEEYPEVPTRYPGTNIRIPDAVRKALEDGEAWMDAIEYVDSVPKEIRKQYRNEDRSFYDMCDDGDYDDVELQAVDPVRMISCKKHPVFLISGPSGTGKSHIARSIGVGEKCEFSTVLDYQPERKPDTVIILDDVTLSEAAYTRAVEIANLQYEQGICKAMIFTENALKRGMFNSQLVAELKRRAHVIEFTYKNPWWRFWVTWDQLAVEYKNELSNAINKEVIVRKNILMHYTEYSGERKKKRATDVLLIVGGLIGKTYGDDHISHDVWTLPMPSEIDFRVALSKNFSECAGMSASEALGSIFTGKLFQITNITGRFNVSTSISMVRDVFKQAPAAKVEDLDSMVKAFNNSNVQSAFRPPGVAVITTPEGAVGLCWRGKNVRMFRITSDPVELDGTKIDVHKYFNPHVESVYKELLDTISFTQESIDNTEQAIIDTQFSNFKAGNIFCQVMECFVSVLSISAQILAPVSLAMNAGKTLKERSELKYLRATQSAARNFAKSKKTGRVVPLVKIGGQDQPLGDLEKALRSGGLSEEDARIILIENPQVLGYFNHQTTSSLYPRLRELATTTAVAAFPTLESIPSPTTRLYTAESYGGTERKEQKTKPDDVLPESAPLKEITAEEIFPEAFASTDEYNAWKERNYGKLAHEDDYYAEEKMLEDALIDEETWLAKQEQLEAERARIDEEIQRWSKFQNPNDWAAEESREVPKKQQKPITIAGESREVPRKQQQKIVVVKTESQEKPQKQQKRVEVVATESQKPRACKWYTNENSTIVDASRIEVRPGDQRYVFMKDGKWDSCNGEHLDVAQKVKHICRTMGFKWAVFFIPAGTNPDVVNEILDDGIVQKEGVEQFPQGTILRVKRKMGPYWYWHYGIVGPAISGEGNSLYHVQSRYVDGELSAYVAVEPLEIAKDWLEYFPETTEIDENIVHCLKKRKNFDFLLDHAFNTFAYASDKSNCETWALAMAYENTDDIVTQELPKTFEPLLEITKTFTSVKGRFAELRALEDEIQLESCVDPTALAITRNTLPNNQVLIFSGSTLLCRGLGIKDRYILSVAHIARDNMSIGRWIDGKLEFFAAEIVKEDPRLDLAIYEVTEKRMRSFKDITGYFMTIQDIKDSLAYGSESLAIISILGKENNCIQSYGCKVKGQLHEYSGEQIGQNGISFTSTIVGATAQTGFTEKGDCGAPLVFFKPQIARKIIGVHRAGSKTQMYASPVPQEWLRSQLKSLHVTREARTTGYVQLQGIDPDTGLDLVGMSSYPATSIKGTKIRVNPIDSKVFPNDGEPAILSSKDPRAEGYNPALTTLRKFKRDPVEINKKELEQTADELADYLSVMLHGKNLRVFSTTEAINGPSRTEYPLAGQIDRSTSAGFPQTQRDKVQNKAQYFEQYNVGSVPLWKIARTPLGEALKDDLSSMIGVAKAGRTPDVVFSYFPKDEVLKKKKIVTPNTRGILSGNVPYVLAYRKYFLALHLRCQEIYRKIPIKIGIDPKSFEWTELADYHLKVSDVGFDADAKNWDASIPLELMQICPRVINRIYKALDPNWTPQDDTVRSALHACVESPKILYDGKIVQPRGGQVSGQPGTAFDNSLINWIMCAIIFKRTMKKKGLNRLATFDAFMKHTAPSFYGDDMLITLSGEVVNDFGLSDYVKEAATFGIEITPADKDSAHKEHMKLSQMTFLKRGFKKIGLDYVGPIERASIAKAIKWLRGFGAYVPTMRNGAIAWKTTMDYGIMRENFENQLIEAALHGESDFTMLRTELNELLDDLGMDLLTITYHGALAGVGVRIE